MLVVTDQHTAWAWGGNAAGQLGLGSSGVAGNGSAWVAAPVEVLGADAAAQAGHPVAAACGDEHAALLCRNGQVLAAGSNACGACGLPVVQLRALWFSQAALPAGQAAAALSCGGRNTAVVTRNGCLLVCGSNEHGQAGSGHQGGCCYGLADIGPSAAWHGMQRTNQQAAGGGGEAAAAAADVACGSGSLYVRTDAGDVFSWGQGGQGKQAVRWL